MISPSKARKLVHHALCVHEFKATAVGEIANTETCFKCFTTRFIFHDDTRNYHHLSQDLKAKGKLITDIVRRKPKYVLSATTPVDKLDDYKLSDSPINRGDDV